MEILKRYEDVANYIQEVRSCADQHKNELGFLASSVYQDLALQGRLWICVSKDEKAYLGHLLFGGKYPVLKIVQLLVHPDYRKLAVPFHLLAELEAYGIKNSYLNITARVAEDLPANRLYEGLGFALIRTVRGGLARGRTINLRSRELETTSLLSIIEAQVKHDPNSLRYTHSPIYRNNQYVLDLNIVLDATRNRRHSREAITIIRAGLNNQVRLAVTQELLHELKRTGEQRESDPLLELASGLPIVKAEDESAVQPLISELRSIIFPSRSIDRKAAAQDASDLLHIAHSILSSADGFITREKAILKAKDKLYSKYELDVISPFDIQEPGVTRRRLKVSGGRDDHLKIRSIEDGDVANLRNFLLKNRVVQREIEEICSQGTTGAIKERNLILYNDQVVGVAVWETPTSIIRQISAFLIVDEDIAIAEKAIDHALELIIRGNNADFRKIILYLCSGQSKTRSSALLRGFRSGSTSQLHNGSILVSMIKVSFTGAISHGNWGWFAQSFQKVAGISLPRQMPQCSSMDDTCIKGFDTVSGKEFWVSYFDLETLVSPAVMLPQERTGILVPIRPPHALELGLYLSNQLSFLARQEAFLQIEKAYFRQNRDVSKYKRGMLIILYVSGRDESSKRAVGCARISYSEALPLDVVTGKFYRHGVLPMSQLSKLQDRKGLIHCITFDNFINFPVTVPYDVLKENNFISKRNLVTGEPQSHAQIAAILSFANKGSK